MPTVLEPLEELEIAGFIYRFIFSEYLVESYAFDIHCNYYYPFCHNLLDTTIELNFSA